MGTNSSANGSSPRSSPPATIVAITATAEASFTSTRKCGAVSLFCSPITMCRYRSFREQNQTQRLPLMGLKCLCNAPVHHHPPNDHRPHGSKKRKSALLRQYVCVLKKCKASFCNSKIRIRIQIVPTGVSSFVCYHTTPYPWTEACVWYIYIYQIYIYLSTPTVYVWCTQYAHIWVNSNTRHRNGNTQATILHLSVSDRASNTYLTCFLYNTIYLWIIRYIL